MNEHYLYISDNGKHVMIRCEKHKLVGKKLIVLKPIVPITFNKDYEKVRIHSYKINTTEIEFNSINYFKRVKKKEYDTYKRLAISMQTISNKAYLLISRVSNKNKI